MPSASNLPFLCSQTDLLAVSMSCCCCCHWQARAPPPKQSPPHSRRVCLPFWLFGFLSLTSCWKCVVRILSHLSSAIRKMWSPQCHKNHREWKESSVRISQFLTFLNTDVLLLRCPSVGSGGAEGGESHGSMRSMSGCIMSAGKHKWLLGLKPAASLFLFQPGISPSL